MYRLVQLQWHGLWCKVGDCLISHNIYVNYVHCVCVSHMQILEEGYRLCYDRFQRIDLQTRRNCLPFPSE